jgi:hypothetical protein
VSGPRSKTEAVARAVSFSVVGIASGVTGRVSIGGWGGPDDSPDHITLRYGTIFDDAAVEVTTYPVEPWDPEPLETLVGSMYGILWQAEPKRRRRAAELAAEGREVRAVDRRKVRYTVRIYPGVDQEHLEAEAAERQLASERAARSELRIRLDDTTVAAHAIGDDKLWAAAFSTRIEGEPLTALLLGRGVAVDSITLKLISDVPGELTRVEDERLPGWRLEFDEVSAGVYRLLAVGPDGQMIEATGPNTDRLIDETVETVRRWATQSDPR